MIDFDYQFVALMMAVSFLACALVYARRAGRDGELLNDTLDALEYGLIFFDQKDRFFKANNKVFLMLPVLSKTLSNLSLSDFLNFMYDHALDCDESLKNTLYKMASRSVSPGFREVVLGGDERVYLIEAEKTSRQRTKIVVLDVTDLSRQEAHFMALNEYNHTLSQAAEAATNGIVVFLPFEQGFKVRFVNSSFCKSIKAEANAVQGSNVLDLLSNMDDQEIGKKIGQALQGGEQYGVELVDSGAGVSRFYDFKITPVHDRNDQLMQFIGVMTDTTELKSREARLSGAQKLEALGRVSAGVAHDFNNILSIIDGCSRLAVKNIPEDDEETLSHLERVRTASERGASLTRQMLTFGRHEVVTDEVIDVVQAVKSHETLLKPLVEASMEFEINYRIDSAMIEGSADTVMQVLMNLVVNGLDAMADPGSLKVDIDVLAFYHLSQKVIEQLSSQESAQSFVCIAVSDTGMGIEQDVLDRIFDPFFSTKSQGKGTGLGLSLVYGLVRQMRGVIDVETQLGQGTTFYIYIPVSEKKPSKAVKGDLADASSLSLEGYTVLLAEDEPHLLELVTTMLEEAGMAVLPASDGNEALVLQDDYEGNIDLLLTDVVMPELGGVDLASLFASLRPETKTLFMSGYPAESDMSSLELPEGAFFLAKPVRYEQLIRMVYHCLFPAYEDSAFEQNGAGLWVMREDLSEGGMAS